MAETQNRFDFEWVRFLGAQMIEPLIGVGFFVDVALLWVIPDRRIERAIANV